MDPRKIAMTAIWATCILIQETRPLPEGLGYSLEKYDESPGLYYELLGEAVLYNTEWKTIVYVSLKESDSNTEQLGQYINFVNKLCKSTEAQDWTSCNHFSELSRNRFQQLKGTEKVLEELIGKHVNTRRKEAL
jgi:hypothetical protein